ncbi:MAG: hypothetical protein HY342_02560 [Candidatus Lambdaproteobacteria bacterium]|nr:hypothetical protein [Candidatus Lambdaproteobacteria bacterium]
MNTMQAHAFDENRFLHAQAPSCAPLSGAADLLCRTASAIGSRAERRMAAADERVRQRTRLQFQRAMVRLSGGANRFDPRTDDVFARGNP